MFPVACHLAFPALTALMMRRRKHVISSLLRNIILFGLGCACAELHTDSTVVTLKLFGCVREIYCRATVSLSDSWPVRNLGRFTLSHTKWPSVQLL